MGASEQSAAIAALLDRRVYEYLYPLFPGGLLVLCIMVGKPELRNVALTSEGFGYVFRISLIVATAWVLGGVIFLTCLLVAGMATGYLARNKKQEPWNISIWRLVVTRIVGAELVPESHEGEESDWKLLYNALEQTFPDDTAEQGLMLGTLLLSAGISFAIGTIWWPVGRRPVLYLAAVVAFLVGCAFIYAMEADTSSSMAARQIGALFRHKLDSEKKSDSDKK